MHVNSLHPHGTPPHSYDTRTVSSAPRAVIHVNKSILRKSVSRIKNSNSLIIFFKKSPIKKWTKDLKTYKWPTKANEKMLNIVSHLRNANQNAILLHMHYDEYNRKDRTTAGKNVRKPKPCNAARGNAKWCGCFGKWSGDSSTGQTQSYPMTQQVRPRCIPHEMKTAKVETSQMPTR